MTTALTELSDIEIRCEGYSLECAERIAEVCRASFNDAWSFEAVEGALRAEQNIFVTANGGALGFAAASLAFDSADVLDIAVMPNARGRGIGKRMLLLLLSLLRERGCESVFLEVRASNAAAISLYSSVGFIPCGVRKNYYSSPREDALIYSLDMREQTT